jgi:hypothetical protein
MTRSLLLSHSYSFLCEALSLTRGRVCLLPESQSAVVSQLSLCTIYILHVVKRLSVCIYMYMYKYKCMCTQYTYTRPLSVQARYSRSCPIINSSFYNGSLLTLTVVCLTAAKFMRLILYVDLATGCPCIDSARNA